MIVSCLVDDQSSIRPDSSKAAMKDWVREYRAYALVMEQAERMHDFQAAQRRHAEAARQLQRAHMDFACLQQTQEAAIEQSGSIRPSAQQNRPAIRTSAP